MYKFYNYKDITTITFFGLFYPLPPPECECRGRSKIVSYQLVFSNSFVKIFTEIVCVCVFLCVSESLFLIQAAEHLEFYGRIRGVPADKLHFMVKELMDRLTLTEFAARHVFFPFRHFPPSNNSGPTKISLSDFQFLFSRLVHIRAESCAHR
jgi:hypothetical protein